MYRTLSFVALFVAHNIGAQVCNGSASFANGPVQIGGAASFGEGTKSYVLDLTGGNSRGLWGNVGVGLITFDDFEDNATVYGVTVGVSVPLTPSRKAELCPFAGASGSSGPDIDTPVGRIENTGAAGILGVGVGGVVSSSATFDFVPFASAALIWIRTRSELGTQDTTFTDSNGSIGIGAGLIFNKTITVQPSVSFPLGAEGADPSFSIKISFSVGSRRE